MSEDNRKLRGFFLAAEGIDGCGKTTQCEALELYLAKQGYDVVYARAPGGTELSEALRTLFLENHRQVSPQVELGLLFTAMADSYDRVIAPALEAGKIVICDRYYLTTYAYQGGGKGIATSLIDDFRESFLPRARPDMWIYYRVEHAIAQARMQERGGKLTTLDKAGSEFFEKVINKFDQLFQHDVFHSPDNYSMIWGDQEIETVHEITLNVVRHRLHAWEKTYRLLKRQADLPLGLLNRTAA